MNSADDSGPKPALQLTAVPLSMVAALLSKAGAQPVTDEKVPAKR